MIEDNTGKGKWKSKFVRNVLEIGKRIVKTWRSVLDRKRGPGKPKRNIPPLLSAYTHTHTDRHKEKIDPVRKEMETD